MISTYLLRFLETDIRISFSGFYEKPCFFSLSPARDNEIRADMNIILYRDSFESAEYINGTNGLSPELERIDGGKYCEIFSVEDRTVKCFFEKSFSIDFILNRLINKAFHAFQEYLDVILLHSALVISGGKTFLFVAPSGGGKSTLCAYALEKGRTVLSEEMCIVKKKDSAFYARRFPFCVAEYDAEVLQKVGGIFFLNKSEKNSLSKISVLEAFQRAVPEATSYRYDYGSRASYRKHVFGFLNMMFENLGFHLLDFTKSAEFLSCLDPV
ncbi:MAG: hypothetical protein ABH883_04815 [Candidatus Omnitrophota bacterium]